jgi:hypothetical protein
MNVWSYDSYNLTIHMILDLGSRDDGDVMIYKYRMIILISYNIRYSGSVITCHMPQYYIILLYDHIVLLYHMNNIIWIIWLSIWIVIISYD